MFEEAIQLGILKRNWQILDTTLQEQATLSSHPIFSAAKDTIGRIKEVVAEEDKENLWEKLRENFYAYSDSQIARTGSNGKPSN